MLPFVSLCYFQFIAVKLTIDYQGIDFGNMFPTKTFLFVDETNKLWRDELFMGVFLALLASWLCFGPDSNNG